MKNLVDIYEKLSVDDISIEESSKYILIPHGEFYVKMSSNRDYADKSFDNCPFAFLWIIDENDLVDLEQKFYKYSHYLFAAPSELSVEEIQKILKTITFKSQFDKNDFTEIKEKELFNLIKRLKDKK